MPSGILILDKPQGWTSQDAAARLRRVFGTRRIGHGGTLDPMATGVLPIFVGRATRAAEFFQQAEKEYVATVRLGVLTDTEDTTGTVLQTRPVTVDRAAVEAALPGFLGPQLQTPPMYSAVKQGGRKLYELARRGVEVPREPRPIEIFELELLDGQGPEYRLRIRCSKGTYVRTLCKDLGLALGCGGCMAALRRTRAGSYRLDQAAPLQTLLDRADRGESVEELLLPVDSLFAACPRLELSPAQAKRCRNGGVFSAPCPPGRYRLYDPDGEFLALGQGDGSQMKTIKSFFEVN